MKQLIVLTLFLASVLSLSCSGNKTAANKANANAPEVKKGVAPVADSEAAVIEMENAAAYGTIKIELYSNIAPLMVARFKELANEGVYDGTTFHRIKQSVIQGSYPQTKDADPSNDGQGK